MPLALLSAAWTVHLSAPTVGAELAGSGVDGAVLGAGVLPGPADADVPEVPAETVVAPASLSAGAKVDVATDGRFVPVSAPPLTIDIPAVALSAYQRAETVINAADADCNLSWQLLAAVGRVESDHGRFGGSSLDESGVARPAILGVVLDGRRGTARIVDTDAGHYDGNNRLDRAVGPMQFIPSTWSVVGVDGDNDGVRDPQDIDDAALAAAVYLCSGPDDLSGAAGQAAAVYRYNHSDAYVASVLAIMRGYLSGTMVGPTATSIAAGALVPIPLQVRQVGPTVDEATADLVEVAAPMGQGEDQAEPLALPTAAPAEPPDVVVQPLPTGTPSETPSEVPSDEPTIATQPSPNDPAPDPAPAPTDEPTDQPTDQPTGVPTGEPSSDPVEEPTGNPAEDPADEPTDEPTISTQSSGDDPAPEPVPADEPTDEPAREPADEPTDPPSDVDGEDCPTDVEVDDPTAEDCTESEDGVPGGPTDQPQPDLGAATVDRRAQK